MTCSAFICKKAKQGCKYFIEMGGGGGMGKTPAEKFAMSEGW